MPQEIYISLLPYLIELAEGRIFPSDFLSEDRAITTRVLKLYEHGIINWETKDKCIKFITDIEWIAFTKYM